jgi:hypothetical protein
MNPSARLLRQAHAIRPAQTSARCTVNDFLILLPVLEKPALPNSTTALLLYSAIACARRSTPTTAGIEATVPPDESSDSYRDSVDDDSSENGKCDSFGRYSAARQMQSCRDRVPNVRETVVHYHRPSADRRSIRERGNRDFLVTLHGRFSNVSCKFTKLSILVCANAHSVYCHQVLMRKYHFVHVSSIIVGPVRTTCVPCCRLSITH